MSINKKLAALLVIFSLCLSIAFIRQEQSIDRLNTSIRKNCESITLITDVALFATEPADLTGLTPERLPVVEALNATRSKFRVKLNNITDTLEC